MKPAPDSSSLRDLALNLVWLAAFFFLSLAPVASEVSAEAATAKQPAVQSTADPFDRLRHNVIKFELPNGLRVLLYRRTIAPVFAGQTWVKVGGVNEVPGLTGISHFLEHMAFKGTTTIGTSDYARERPLLLRLDELMKVKGHPVDGELKEVESKLDELWKDNEFSRLYQQRGADGLNAATSKDYTQYVVNLPNVAFEFWCWMESERILHPVFRQFYRERQVVLEERRSRFDDNPSGLLYETLLGLSFLAHPNRLPVIGYRSDVDQLTVSDMEQFYRQYYRPDNIVLVLIGDIDPVKARPLIERYFGRIPAATEPLPEVRTVEPPQLGAREAIVDFEAEPQFFMAYHKPTYPDPDDARFAVLHSLLASGRSSILERELVQRRQIAISVGTSEAPGVLFPNLFTVAAAPRNGVTAKFLRDEIQKIFDRLKQTLVSQTELEAAKRRVRVNFLKALPSNEGLAEILAEGELLFGDWQSTLRSYDQILATTAEDIRNLARHYLNEETRTYVELRKREPRQ